MTLPSRSVLCPYCGHTESRSEERCGACGGFFDKLSRKVSQQHMGPWFIRDQAMAFRPGCSYDVLVKRIHQGKVTADTVIRGPTTKQFWSLARNVPGVAHLLGYCHKCSQPVHPAESTCNSCGTHFLRPSKRDKLGLDADNPQLLEEVQQAHAQAAAGLAMPSTQAMGAPSRTAPPGATPAIATAIRDDQMQEAADSTAEAPASSINLTWILVGLNIVVAVVAIVFVLKMFLSGPPTTNTPSSPPPPVGITESQRQP